MNPAVVAAGGAVVAFGATAALTRPLIDQLAARQLGKAIRAEGPDHSAKAGTPTMGGLALLAVLFVLAVVLPRALPAAPPTGLGPVVAALVAFGLIGALDDWLGLARKGRARELGVGLRARHLVALQVAAALGLALALAPRDGSAAAWGLMAVVALLGTVNGVNLSDGLDGLAAGLLALAFGGLAAILWPAGALAPAAWSLAAAGACLGFLVWNRHPARVFMGNVTSMALGGALATLALRHGAWPLLPIVGGVFVVEVLSDIVQVGAFKATGGRRVLRCAPLHHHFEMGGWPETLVVRRFWSAGLVCAVLGVAIALTLGVGAPR